MVRHWVLTLVAPAAAPLAVAASASASAIHPRLAAKLSGMGEHGTVNLEFVWVNIKGHPGDLRGRLFRGMSHA
jgi:hypothetical protein